MFIKLGKSCQLPTGSVYPELSSSFIALDIIIYYSTGIVSSHFSLSGNEPGLPGSCLLPSLAINPGHPLSLLYVSIDTTINLPVTSSTAQQSLFGLQGNDP